MTDQITNEAPHPMGSFEDTAHAYETGYAAGYAAGFANGQQDYKNIQKERDVIAAATVETLAMACLQEAQRRRKMAADLRARAPVNEDNNLQYNRWIAGAISLEVMASKAHEITPTDALAALARIKGEAAGLQLRAEKAEADLAAEAQRAEDQAALVKCACAYEKPTDICEGHKRIFDRINAGRAADGDMISRAEAQRAFAKAYRFCGSIREIEAAAEDNDAFLRAWAALEAIPAAPAPQNGEGDTPDFWFVEGLVFETEAEAQHAARCGGLGADRIQPVRCIPATAQKGEA